MEKEDKRIKKSKKAIKNALIELVQEKDINEITIQELALKADVDRKTIYNNYQNIYEIFEDFANDLASSFDDILDKLANTSIYKDPSIVLKALNKTIEENRDLYILLSKINKNNSFIRDKLYEKLKIKISKAFEKNKFIDNNNFNFIIEFITSGMIAAFQTWFLNDEKNKPNLEDFSKTIATIVFNGLNGLIK